jgi:hypothetical protein
VRCENRATLTQGALVSTPVRACVGAGVGNGGSVLEVGIARHGVGDMGGHGMPTTSSDDMFRRDRGVVYVVTQTPGHGHQACSARQHRAHKGDCGGWHRLPATRVDNELHNHAEHQGAASSAVRLVLWQHRPQTQRQIRVNVVVINCPRLLQQRLELGGVASPNLNMTPQTASHHSSVRSPHGQIALPFQS